MGLHKSNSLSGSTATVGNSSLTASAIQVPNELTRFQQVGPDGTSVPLEDATRIPQSLKNEFANNVAAKTAMEEAATAGKNPPIPDNLILTFFIENIKTFSNQFLQRIRA